MADVDVGYIPIIRSLFNHSIWSDKEPFDKRSAWIDLIQMAYYRDSQIIDGMTVVKVQRGSFITSKQLLAKRWHWSVGKVRRYLEMLESDQMIEQKSTHRWTHITLCNYCTINDLVANKRHSTDTVTAHCRHTGSTQKKKENKDNKENKCIYGKLDNVELSDAEYKDIESTYANVNALIDKVSIWLGNNYRANHYATILQFAENDNWPKKLKATELPDIPVDSVPMPNEIKDKLKRLF